MKIMQEKKFTNLSKKNKNQIIILNVFLIISLLSIFITLFIYSVFRNELINPPSWLPEVKRQFQISLWWVIFLEISLPIIFVFILLYIAQIYVLKINGNKFLYSFFPLIFINKLVASESISKKQYVRKILISTILVSFVDSLIVFQLFLYITNSSSPLLFIAFVFNFLLLNISYGFRIYYVVKIHKKNNEKQISADKFEDIQKQS